MRLGPQGFNKIAVIGSAPSTTLLAPFDDPSWAIWCTSPSVFSTCGAKRTDVWFELHRWLPYKPAHHLAPGTRPWFSPEFHQFLKDYKGTVFMTEKQPDIPNCVQYPYKEMLDKYGPYHFGSSIAWMLAKAIETLLEIEGPKYLGLFGIDMAAGEEWGYQRPSCQHWLGLAKAAGIEIVLPPESDLMRHSTLYGIGEHNQRHVKLRERLNEIEANIQAVTQRMNQDQAGLNQLQGARDQVKYMLELWSDDVQGDLEQAMSFSGVFVKSLPTQVSNTQITSEMTAKCLDNLTGVQELMAEVQSVLPKKRKRKGNGALQPDA